MTFCHQNVVTPQKLRSPGSWWCWSSSSLFIISSGAAPFTRSAQCQFVLRIVLKDNQSLQTLIPGVGHPLHAGVIKASLFNFPVNTQTSSNLDNYWTDLIFCCLDSYAACWAPTPLERLGGRRFDYWFNLMIISPRKGLFCQMLGAWTGSG